MGTDVTQLNGIIAAVVTPMDESQRVDAATLRRLVEHLVASGLDGIAPCGSTGEFPSLSPDERRLVVETVLDAVGGRVPVVPHTGAMTTEETVSLSRHAEDHGAAAVMVVAPYYETLSWSDLVDHFTAIREAVTVPIVYYHLPGATGLALSPKQLVEFASTTGIDYVKVTNGDAQQLGDLIRNHGADIKTFVGWDSLVYEGLSAGAVGSIWGMANFLPEQCRRLYTAVSVERDFVTAQALWAAMRPVARFLEGAGGAEPGSYVAGVKAGCALTGLPVGDPRRPLRGVPASAGAELAALIERAKAAAL